VPGGSEPDCGCPVDDVVAAADRQQKVDFAEQVSFARIPEAAVEYLYKIIKAYGHSDSPKYPYLAN